MEFWPERILGLRKRQLFNLYLLLGSISIVVSVTAFTIHIARSVERQNRLTTELFAGMASRLLKAEDLRNVGQVIRIINDIEVPFIITDVAGRPVLWNEPVIGIPLPATLDQLRTQMDDPTVQRNPNLALILGLVAKFDDGQQPFAVIDPASGERLGTLHYGQSALSYRIRWMPYLELMLMALFFLLILWALQAKRGAEQQALFAGMAKETAHQLGTPLTSIMGWLAVLRDEVGPGSQVMLELGNDVDRLNKISARFSQIGSQPKLDDTDLEGLVQDVVVYFRRRLPHLGGHVELRSEGTIRNICRFNRELMGWVLENLIKNGMDALRDGQGTIIIKLSDDENGVVIRVSDTGKGMTSNMRGKVFDPGFSTKERGWGMGLALVKRIVKRYHNGRIRIESTSPEGTTFAITLPGEEPTSGLQDSVG